MPRILHRSGRHFGRERADLVQAVLHHARQFASHLSHVPRRGHAG
jgi:hypothetical protein